MTIHGTRLYDVTQEASQWRDLSIKQQHSELLVRIALVSGIILVLTGMALGFYFSCTTTETITRVTGEVIQSSNAGFSAFPGLF